MGAQASSHMHTPKFHKLADFYYYKVHGSLSRKISFNWGVAGGWGVGANNGFILSHQGRTNLPREAIVSSPWVSVAVFLRTPIATCDFPVGVGWGGVIRSLPHLLIHP